MYERHEKERKEATPAHVPVQPTLPEDIAVARNGERQLLRLEPGDLSVIGLLMASDVYSINQRLRTARSLDCGAGAMIDYAGYTSMQHFVDDASAVFGHLADSITLDAPIKLYRGIGVPQEPDEYSPDVAGISAYLTDEVPWQEEFHDAGFGFATTDPAIALCYDGTARGDSSPKVPVLLELDASQGLCSPSKEHRSPDLFGHVFGTDFLADASGQVIFPPGTRWRVISVEKTSVYGTPVVRIKQLISELAEIL